MVTRKALALVATVILIVEGAAIHEQKSQQIQQAQALRSAAIEGGHIHNGPITRSKPGTTGSTSSGKGRRKPSKHVQNSPGNRGKLTAKEREIIAALETGKYTTARRPVRNSRGADRYNIRLVSAGIFKLTAYTAGHESTGKRPGDKGYGHTKSGRLVQEGVTVASNWKQLPPGTLLYIEGVGVRRVDDSGGAMRKNRLDVYIPKLHDARHFGVIHRKVYIIKGVTL